MSKTGFIYKLAHNDPEIKEIYIGSTDNLRLRKSSHKHCCNTETNKSYNFRVYQFIRSNGGFSNFNIFQIEEIKYNTKYELHARERYHIELLNPSLNKATPNRTHQEWEEKNKEEIKERKKQYYKENKEHILERTNQYKNNIKDKILKNFNCQCGGKYTNSNKINHCKTQRHLNFTRLPNAEVINDIQPGEANLTA